MVEDYRAIYKKYHADVDISGLHIHHLDGDRTNNDISNLIAITQEDHYKIHFFQRDFGACSLLSDGIDAEAPTTPIVQYDLDGYFVSRFNSVQDAAISLNITHRKLHHVRGTIVNCCKYGQKSFSGYQWFYESEVGDRDNVGPVERKRNNGGNNTSKLEILDTQTGVFYSSKRAAKRAAFPNLCQTGAVNMIKEPRFI